ncbi:hypothetical protein CASFOL_029068 [Castilleja foliolosa]|uniref:Epoxide hydrolase n=1 Tax=Castilleja foliolosa TaxID=1961234 RepID=A0ABD3CCV0_9LAMI
MGIPFMPPRPPTWHESLPEGFYIARWREPGGAEADFGRFDAKTVVKNVYILFSKSEIPTAQENQEIIARMSMGTQDDDISDPKVDLPALLIMGEKDYVLKFPGIEDYIRNGTVKSFVPNLEVVFMPEGTHFVQEQSPDEVNSLILNFLKNHI